MKKHFLVAICIAASFGLAPSIGYSGIPPTPARAPTHAALAQARPQEALKTFSGTVTKQGDIYVLSDKADKTNYQLDDSKKVGEYLGKSVKVTGTLDAENLTIHVETIQEIA